MPAVRSSLLICITILVCYAATGFYFHFKDRFDVVATRAGVFVLDRQNVTLNFCSNQGCNLVLSHGQAVIMPNHLRVQSHMNAIPHTQPHGSAVKTIPQSTAQEVPASFSESQKKLSASLQGVDQSKNIHLGKPDPFAQAAQNLNMQNQIQQLQQQLINMKSKGGTEQVA